MKTFIGNTKTEGLFRRADGTIERGPRYYKVMPKPVTTPQQDYDFGLITLDELKIFNREFSEIKKKQQGK